MTETNQTIAPGTKILDKTFETLIAATPSDPIDRAHENAVELSKNADGSYSFKLTAEGESIDRTYHHAFQLAEEKGANDRDVLALMAEVERKWPSYPGVIENKINDAIETSLSDRAGNIDHAGQLSKAVELAREAAGSWLATAKQAGIMSYKEIDPGTSGGHLFIQLLANYEFALERNNRLSDARSVALLAREIDPTDPENLLSAIIGLYIRTGDAMQALRALEPLQDSLAPYVLYGRALAYYALAQQENARGALHAALRHWPQVAQALVREWKGGTPMPKPGEAVSELQVLYGYFEVFGAAWKSVPGAIEWLREEEKSFARAGAKPQRYIGLTRSGLRTDAQGNAILTDQPHSDEARAAEQAELIRKAQLIGEDEFVRLLEVQPSVYVYDLTARGKELEEAHQELYRKDMKLNARIDAIEEMLKTWPGHANAAIALVRYYAQKERFEDAVNLLEPVIFNLQKFWPDDLVGSGRIPSDWPGNKPLLTAYAYMVLDLAESGDRASAKAYADDYLTFNPADNMGVRQKAIEIYIADGEYATALKLIGEAADPMSAYNVFGRALIGYAIKSNDAELALKNAIESRPLIWREMSADKHRMPHNYNPSFVHYFSQEEAYHYQQTWSGLWMHQFGALAWLKKTGKKYLK
jgi:hypothetical protein